MADPITGKNKVLYLSTTNAGAATNVGELTDASIDKTADRVEDTACGDSNKSYVQVFEDASISFTIHYDSASSQIMDAAGAGESVKMYLYPDSGTTTSYFYGYVWVDYTMDMPMTDVINISGSMAAAGAITWQHA